MVGSGVLTNSGPIIQSTGSYPALITLWIFGGILALAGALTMSELASGVVRAGGDYVYIYKAFGPAWGFVYGWAMGLIGFAAPIALVAYTTAEFLSATFSGVNFGMSREIFAVVAGSILILGFTLFHCVGHRESSFLQGAMTVFKVAVLVIFATLGLLSKPGDIQSHWQESNPLSGTAPSGLALGLVLVMYAYSGWNAVVYLAGETRNPERTIPRCLFWGCASVIGLYLLMNLLYVHAFSVSEVRAFTESQTPLLAEIAVRKLLGEWTARVFSLLISFGALASLSAYVLAGPRVLQGMAQDGIFPRIAGRVHAKREIPVVATLIQGLFALIFLWSGTFHEVLAFTGYGVASLSVLMITPLFVLRKRPDFRPLFRVPFYPWTPVFFLTASLALLIGAALEEPLPTLASLGTLLLGFPVYFLFVRKRK